MELGLKLDDDMIWYFKLHGCTYSGGYLSFIVKDFKYIESENRIIIQTPCSALGTDCLCKIHPNKPLICISQDKESMNSGNYYLTENCLLQ